MRTILLLSGGAAPVTIAPAGISSAQTVGSPRVAPGPIAIAPGGIASGEAVGSPVLAPGPVTIAPGGIASREAVGNPTLAPGPSTLAPSGIATGEVVGTPSVAPGASSISPGGIGSAEAVGVPTLASGPATISPTGIASGEAAGSPSLATGPATVAPGGVGSGESMGSPVLSPGASTITPGGISSAEAVGNPTVVGPGATVAPAGITTAETVGTPSGSAGPATVAPGGVTSGESTGSPNVAPGSSTIAPGGIASGETIGSPTLAPGSGSGTIAPGGVPSAESVGSPIVYATSSGVTIAPPGIGSGESVGTPTPTPGPSGIAPGGIASRESVGSPALSGPDVGPVGFRTFFLAPGDGPVSVLVPRGSTSQTARFFVKSQSTGLGVGGLAYNTAGLSVAYHRAGDPASALVTLVAGTPAAWSSGGFAAVDDLHMPGLVEVGLPDVCWAGGDPVAYLVPPAGAFCEPQAFQITAPDYTTAAAVSAAGFTLDPLDKMVGTDLSGWTVAVFAAGNGAVQAALIGLSDPATNVQTLIGSVWPKGTPTAPVQYSLASPFPDKAGYRLDLAQPLADVATGTVGGALHGAWATAWGKVTKDVVGKVLRVFGIGSQTVPARTFTLDDGANPSTRTPQ